MRPGRGRDGVLEVDREAEDKGEHEEVGDEDESIGELSAACSIPVQRAHIAERADLFVTDHRSSTTVWQLLRGHGRLPWFIYASKRGEGGVLSTATAAVEGGGMRCELCVNLQTHRSLQVAATNSTFTQTAKPFSCPYQYHHTSITAYCTPLQISRVSTPSSSHRTHELVHLAWHRLPPVSLA